MRLNVFMFGSVPMALNELQLAPAMIAALVRKRGHNFGYKDINLELYHLCKKDPTVYNEKTEFLQNLRNIDDKDDVVESWMDRIIACLEGQHILVLNVFSSFSQGAAYRIIGCARSLYPNLKILLGGIGSHKPIFGSINPHNTDWIQDRFQHHDRLQFGALMLDNGLVNDWQTNVGTDRIEHHLPVLPAKGRYDRLVDFADYELDRYDWSQGKRQIPLLGSHGCVRQCSFCDVIVHFPKYSFIEADTLSQQIVAAYEQTGIARVQFMDSLVNGSMKNFLALLKNLRHAREQGWLPKDFRWSGTYICRPPSVLLDEIHQHLADSGADNLVIGVESGSDRVRFEMEKKFTNQDLIDELESFQRTGVKAKLLFFPAWPTETQEDFQSTLALFGRLSLFAQSGTVDSIALGSTGFGLIDGTPVDRDKEKIGLHPGPTNFLWRCDSNPELDFWETLRRRLLMARYATAVGINLDTEADFLRYLVYNLRVYRDIIKDWTGSWSISTLQPQLTDQLWNTTTQDPLEMRLINSGSQPVIMDLWYGKHQQQHVLDPGITDINTVLDRNSRAACDFRLHFRFSDSYQPILDQYDSLDYYSTNGVYIDLFKVGARDITFYGFNHMFQQDWKDINMPDDYHLHRNQRCVIDDVDLLCQVPADCTLQEFILRQQQPEKYQEIDFLIGKISRL